MGPARADRFATAAAQGIDKIRSDLIEQAEALNAEYPHYRNHWDGWQVGRITRNLQWRGHKGARFRMADKGDLVLVDPVARADGHYRVAFLPKSPVGSGHGVNTSIQFTDVKILG